MKGQTAVSHHHVFVELHEHQDDKRAVSIAGAINFRQLILRVYDKFHLFLNSWFNAFSASHSNFYFLFLYRVYRYLLLADQKGVWNKQTRLRWKRACSNATNRGLKTFKTAVSGPKTQLSYCLGSWQRTNENLM